MYQPTKNEVSRSKLSDARARTGQTHTDATERITTPHSWVVVIIIIMALDFDSENLLAPNLLELPDFRGHRLYLYGLFTPLIRRDKTVLSCPCRRCEHAISCKLEIRSRRDKTHRNWVETRQNCLVSGVNTIGDKTRQDKTVLCRPRRRCEQAITLRRHNRMQSMWNTQHYCWQLNSILGPHTPQSHHFVPIPTHLHNFGRIPLGYPATSRRPTINRRPMERVRAPRGSPASGRKAPGSKARACNGCVWCDNVYQRLP